MGDCSCKIDTQKTPAIFGWVVVYELAIIIMILLFIYLDMDNTSNAANTVETTEQTVVQNVE